MWDFLVFGLGMGAGGVFVLQDRAAVVGQVLIAVGDADIYLAETAQCIPWPEVKGLVVFRTWQDGDDQTQGSGLRRWPSCQAARTSSPVRVRGVCPARTSVV